MGTELLNEKGVKPVVQAQPRGTVVPFVGAGPPSLLKSLSPLYCANLHGTAHGNYLCDRTKSNQARVQLVVEADP